MPAVRILEPISYADRVWEPGIYLATVPELHALQARGRCRCATQDEVERVAAPLPVIGDAAVVAALAQEQATARPVAETAARARAPRAEKLKA